MLHREQPVDLVVAGVAYPMGVVAAAIASVARRPLVVVSHGEDVSGARTSRVQALLLRWVFRQAHHVIVNSNFTAGEVAEFGCLPKHCSVLPPSIDADPFLAIGAADRMAARRRFGLPDRRVLLTVARLEERKGQDTVLKAMAMLPEYRDLHYLVVGPGDPTALKALAERLRLEDRVTITGLVDAEELPNVYAAADIFVMPSRPGAHGDVEGFGMVYLEAAASGLPCIAGTAGGCEDAVIDGVTGWCIDPLDPSSVAEAIRSALQSPESAARRGEDGRRRVVEKYQRSQLQASATDVFEGAVGHPNNNRNSESEPPVA
jgi:phosphatidylinositol alpha-1,6-mannosyltransferase